VLEAKDNTLAQLAALSPDQRAVVAKLLNPPVNPTVPAGLDDSLPSGFEKAKGETG
jgi:hypothetical protein